MSSKTGYRRKVKRWDRNDKDGEEDVGSYWVTLRKGEDTHI
jgi:hypothetical protein